MNLDLTVNVANLIAMFGAIGGFIYFVFKIGNRVDVVAKDVGDLRGDTQMMRQELKKLTEVLIVQGRQDERITAMDQRMVNQGKRLDDTVRRLNTFLDMRSVNRMEDDEG